MAAETERKLMTQESYDKLKEELEKLRSYFNEDIVEQIKEAKSHGDLSENAEYDEAKREQGTISAKIKEMEKDLANAVIITADMYAEDEVSPGCHFVVKDLDLDEEETFYFVGSQEADPLSGKISDESPFGKAMMGKKVGDFVEVDAPEGVIRYQIISLEK